MSRSLVVIFAMVSLVGNGKYPKLQVIMCIFAIVLTVSEILTFYMFYLKKVGQGHRIQISQ